MLLNINDPAQLLQMRWTNNISCFFFFFFFQNLRPKMSATKMIRPLGSIEKFVDCCTVSRNLNMAVAITVKTKNKITLDVLERALMNLQVYCRLDYIIWRILRIFTFTVKSSDHRIEFFHFIGSTSSTSSMPHKTRRNSRKRVEHKSIKMVRITETNYKTGILVVKWWSGDKNSNSGNCFEELRLDECLGGCFAGKSDLDLWLTRQRKIYLNFIFSSILRRESCCGVYIGWKMLTTMWIGVRWFWTFILLSATVKVCFYWRTTHWHIWMKFWRMVIKPKGKKNEVIVIVNARRMNLKISISEPFHRNFIRMRKKLLILEVKWLLRKSWQCSNTWFYLPFRGKVSTCELIQHRSFPIIKLDTFKWRYPSNCQERSWRM